MGELKNQGEGEERRESELKNRLFKTKLNQLDRRKLTKNLPKKKKESVN